MLKKDLTAGTYSDIHYGSSTDDYAFTDLEIHATGEKLTAEDTRQLFEVPVLSGFLHDSHDNTDNDKESTTDTDTVLVHVY